MAVSFSSIEEKFVSDTFYLIVVILAKKTEHVDFAIFIS